MAAAAPLSPPALRRPLVANLCIIALWLSTLAGLCRPDDAAAISTYQTSANSPGLTHHLLESVSAWPSGPHAHRPDSSPSEDTDNDDRQRHLAPLLASRPTVPEIRSAMIAHRMSRGALDKNFLRFGRGGLNKNFLRFGRGGLNKNFLRFGRGDNELDEEETEDSDDNANYDTIQAPEVNAERPEDNEQALEEEKRGQLNRNFLRYGRLYVTPGGKRGSLDRNFLRFGKRSGSGPVVPGDDVAVTPTEDDDDGKAKERDDIWHQPRDGASSESEDHRSRRSVLLLAAPWMKRELAPRHGNAIRRRSLQENFIRFGRR